MRKTYPQFGPYNIIADTNALYSPDPRNLVATGFESELTSVRKLVTVHLFVPDVVIGELAYQKYRVTSEAIASIRTKLKLLGEMTGKSQPTVCSTENAKQLLRKRYSAWCRANNVQIHKCKIVRAIWNRIVDEAIWRISPFEPSQERKHEKGFRDRVVLESVVQLCSTNLCSTVLLTEDGMLKDAATRRGLKNLTVVPRLSDWSSQIRLFKEKARQEWVVELIADATRTFYDADKPDCLYLREKIYDTIGARTEDLVPPPSDGSTSILEPDNWGRQTEDHYTVGTTQYEKRLEKRWLWKTELHSAAVYSGAGIMGVVFEKIRVSSFAVHWSSDPSNSTEIKGEKVENISLVGRQMLYDSADTRSKWNLPGKPAPVTPVQPDDLLPILRKRYGVTKPE